VIAVDASPEMLATARRRARGLPNVELHEADLGALPLADAAVDAALLVLALSHVAEPAAALAEMARILRPGGRAVVVDLLRHDRDEFRREMGQLRNGFAIDELAGLLSDAGLDDVECSPLPPEAEAKGPALLLATGSKPATSSSVAAASRRPARGSR
jgi:SAM-dependent methyltransferase